MKLKHIAIAAALVAASPAFAAIKNGLDGTVQGTGPGVTDQSELFVTVYDDVAKVSFTQDLGVFSKDFRSIATTDGGYSFTWVLDNTYFSQYLSQTSLANAQWMVQGYDGVGPATLNGRSVFTTVTAGQESLVAETTNLQLTNSQGGYSNFIGFTNNLGSHAPFDDYAANGASVSTGPATYALDRTNMGNRGSTLYPFSANNSIGTSSTFSYITRSSTSNLASATVLITPFANLGGQASFSLGLNAATNAYELTYTLAAVPEPGSVALMLAGLGAMGLVVRRRKSA